MTIHLTYSHEGDVATVILDRPEALNALDYDALERVGEAFRIADANGARIILLRGEGRAFCAGADRRNYPGYNSNETNEGKAQHAINIGNQVTQKITKTNALTIAQLHGHVVGGGLVLAMCCDMRFAAENASLSLPELKLGLPLGWGALYRLINIIGTSRAWDMLASLKTLSGKEAIDVGLCNAAVDEGMLSNFVSGKIEEFLQIEVEALYLTKRQFRAISSTASLGNLEDMDGPILLGPLRGNKIDSSFEEL
ncbi:MAG: enoyl-CoA hydratase/isomerase family protein [Sneathiella sp.]|uniref:enoyl-CoA hydratase/isomerase family protein n=1 Tax=Sneathiella sp. TaxID=1964365 RepID=UPI003001BF0E